MHPKDQLFRFSFENLGLRGELVQLEASWQGLLERHPGYPEPVGRLLGEACAAVLLLSAVIKFRGSLILQVQSRGLLRALVAQATDRRTMRGLARWNGEPKGDDLRDWVTDGRLVLTVEAPNGERYQGIVPVGGERLSDALETYFTQSEQLPTRLWLACQGGRAAGLMLQALPSRELLDEDWRRVGLLADTVLSAELLDMPAEQLLQRLFHEETVRLFEPEPVAFRCGCSRDRISAVLISLGREEVEKALSEEGRLTIDCEFCGRRHLFDSVDVEGLFSAQALAHASSAQH